MPKAAAAPLVVSVMVLQAAAALAVTPKAAFAQVGT